MEFDGNVIGALLTLTSLEVVLGIDNVVFISILSGNLPGKQQDKARILGLVLAMVARIGLLLSISFIMKLTKPLFTVLNTEISGKDIILVVGGLFLLGKSSVEIYKKMEVENESPVDIKKAVSFGSVISQIVLLDVIFSLDSVITAVGMTDMLWVMVTAIVVAVIFMIIFAKAVSNFIEKHPSFKVLALSFLLLIGFTLILEGLDQHIDKAYIYFAMGFSLFVQVLNMKIKKKHA